MNPVRFPNSSRGELELGNIAGFKGAEDPAWLVDGKGQLYAQKEKEKKRKTFLCGVQDVFFRFEAKSTMYTLLNR